MAELVPDIPVPSKIFAEIKGIDKVLWLEGWCDGCMRERDFLRRARECSRDIFSDTRGPIRGLP